MNRTRTVATLLLAAVLLAGCTAGADPKSAPPTPTLTSPSPSPTVTLSLTAHKAWCTEALVKRHAGRSGELQSDPQPVECLGLENHDFLNAYYDALMEVNRKGREAVFGPRPTG